jgi:hypothetical protein
MNRWQYEIYQQAPSQSPQDVVRIITDFGADGWELVSVIPIRYGDNPSGLREYTFKRPAPVQPKKSK